VALGAADSTAEGTADSTAEGAADSTAEGAADSTAEGAADSTAEGAADSTAEGTADITAEGVPVGTTATGNEGAAVVAALGASTKYEPTATAMIAATARAASNGAFERPPAGGVVAGT
jgi:hypothetical protein